MKISASQRKALEAAGYTVSKSGSTVQNKSGGTVGGYNENGKVFSGSKTVRDILKGTSETSKATTKATTKSTSTSTSKAKAKEKPVAKDAMKGYRAGDVVTTKLAGSSKTDKMRGKARVDAGTKAFEGRIRKALDRADNSENNSSLPVAAPAAVVAASRGKGSASGRAYNPRYGSQKLSPEGYQGRYATEVSRPSAAKGATRIGSSRGAPGINSGKVARKLGTKGGRRALKADDFNPFLN